MSEWNRSDWFSLLAIIVSAVSAVLSGVTFYRDWRKQQEDILVNFLGVIEKTIIHDISLNPSNDFEPTISSIGKWCKFSLVNKTSEPIFITKVYYKDAKTNKLEETKIFSSKLPIELLPSIPFETTVYIPLYVAEKAGELISIHLLQEDYVEKFKNPEENETILELIQNHIFFRVFAKKHNYQFNGNEEEKQFVEQAKIAIRELMNIFKDRIENRMLPTVTMKNLKIIGQNQFVMPTVIRNEVPVTLTGFDKSGLFKSSSDFELSKLLLRDLEEQKIQEKDLLPQFSHYEIIIQTSKETLFPIKLKSENSLFELTMIE